MTRVPVVLGLGRRSGASTVAAALHATESRRPPLVARGPGCSADVVVCAGDEASLSSASVVRGATVLLVVLVDDTAPPTQARQQELARHHGAVVVLPHVREWAGLSGAPDKAATLFARQPEQLPPALCAYTRGLRLAVAALLRTDVLARPRPPALTTPAGPTPAEAAPNSPAFAVPGPAGTLPARGLDDEAIEAEVLAAAAHGSQPAAARPAGPAVAAAASLRPPSAPTLGRPASPLHIRALHRPVMGPVRGESAKAG